MGRPKIVIKYHFFLVFRRNVESGCYSAYCYDIELKEAFKRHAQGTMTIVPIIGEPCDW